ncbi:hypothetical protein AGMMS50268_17120 [Spirochaetia bacterium]|nr:hypothetical protein AGMMS50268_17120 [Spirochaetia bacterium]
MVEENKSTAGLAGDFKPEQFEYDFGAPEFKAEIADKETDDFLDKLFDEALGEEKE